MFAAFSKLTQNYIGQAETLDALAKMILDAPGYCGAIDGYEALDIGSSTKNLDYVPLFKARRVNKAVAWPITE